MTRIRLTDEDRDFLLKLSLGIQQGDTHWIKTGLELKEKADLWDSVKDIDVALTQKNIDELKDKSDRLDEILEGIKKWHGFNDIGKFHESYLRLEEDLKLYKTKLQMDNPKVYELALQKQRLESQVKEYDLTNDDLRQTLEHRTNELQKYKQFAESVKEFEKKYGIILHTTAYEELKQLIEELE